jgi:HPt (histidine-containing phosphotransfer) domain-containing protein
LSYYRGWPAPEEDQGRRAADRNRETLPVGETHGEFGELLTIRGLDVAGALKHTAGKPALYANLLEHFVEEYRSFAEDMAHLLRDGHLADAQRLSHTLKGVAATIGAHRVSAAASEFENALLKHGEPGRALENVQIELAMVIAALGSYFQRKASRSNGTAENVPQTEQPAYAALPAWLHEFRTLLSEGDVAAKRVCDAHSEELRRLLPSDSYQRVCKAVEDFRFDTALEILPNSPVEAEA